MLWAKEINESIKDSVIYTDAFGMLTTLHPRNALVKLLGNIMHNIARATAEGCNIKFPSVPSRVGIADNERAECALLNLATR